MRGLKVAFWLYLAGLTLGGCAVLLFVAKLLVSRMGIALPDQIFEAAILFGMAAAVLAIGLRYAVSTYLWLKRKGLVSHG